MCSCPNSAKAASCTPSPSCQPDKGFLGINHQLPLATCESAEKEHPAPRAITINAFPHALQPANHWHKHRHMVLQQGARCLPPMCAAFNWRLIAWTSRSAAYFSVSYSVCCSCPDAVKFAVTAAAAVAAVHDSTLLPSPSVPCTLPSSFMLLLSHQYSVE